MCFVDLEKAFDRVVKQNVLESNGFENNLVETSKASHKKMENIVNYDNRMTEKLRTIEELGKGATLAHLCSCCSFSQTSQLLLFQLWIFLLILLLYLRKIDHNGKQYRAIN